MWYKNTNDIRILIIKCTRNHIFLQIYEDEKVSYCIFPDPPCCTTTRVGNENSYIFLVMHIFHSSKVKDYQRILSAKQNEKKQVRKYKDYQKILSIELRTWTDTKTHNTQICTRITKRILSAELGIWDVDKSPPTQNVECLPVYPYILLYWVVGQFGTVQFGTKIVKTNNLAPRRQTDILAPR